LLDKSVIILAGGTSRGFDADKGTLELGNKPLIRHVFDAVESIVDEVIVVTNLQERADVYAKLLPENVKFVLDSKEAGGPLVGALTGLEAAQGKYSMLLPADAPFVSTDLAILLFDLCIGKSATMPRNPDNEIEPLCAVYQTKVAIEAAKIAEEEGASDLETMVEKLRGVRFISTMVIEQIDSELRSFFSVNTPMDLKRAAVMLQSKNKNPKTKEHRSK
jgi:molybdopterin-guanine dinucleotide biosynthesis protein A